MKQEIKRTKSKKEENFDKETARKWTIDELMELGRS